MKAKRGTVCSKVTTNKILFPQCSHITAAAAAKWHQLCPTLCNPIDGSPPGSPIPGILRARTLEWVAISFSNVWKWKVKVNSFSRVRLFCGPMNSSPLGSSVHRIFQARVLEWVAIAFSDITGPSNFLVFANNVSLTFVPINKWIQRPVVFLVEW